MEGSCTELCRMMMRINRIHHRVNMTEVSRLGIHPSEHFLLMHLNDTGEAASQCQIADRMDVSPASVARTIKNLDAGGYIARNESAGDGRRNEIRITEKGKAIAEESKRMFSRTDEKIFENFSEEELNCLRGFLERMTENIRALEQSKRM